jgi:hypothetical protein
MKQLIVAIALIVLAGCVYTPPPLEEPPKPPTQGIVFSGGTNALLINFEQDAPPDLVYDSNQTPLEIILSVRNEGEFDTGAIKWSVTGINSNDFANLQTEGTYPDAIAGRTRLQDEVIEGEQTYLFLESSDRQPLCYQRTLPDGSSIEMDISAHVCYAYATLASATVCIQEDYLDGSDGCDPSESSQISVSGAPVTITGYSQQAVGTKRLRLEFDVALRNNMRVWAPMENQDCKPETRAERIAEANFIYARIDTNTIGGIECASLREPSESDSRFDGSHILSDAYPQDSLSANAIRVQDIDMTTEGYFRLGPDNRASIICTLEVDDGLTDSLGTIDLALTYFIEDMVWKPITVVSSGEEPRACE